MKPTSMHQVPRINPIISGIDHELVRRWVTLALALSSLCPIFTFFGLLCFCFSLFFLFPILTLILLLKLLFDHNPSRLIDVRSAILGSKFNRLTELQGLISTITSTDIDEENDNNNNNNNNAKLVLQLGHDLEEKQENFDLDSVELPVFYETDDDDEKPVQRSTVEEREQARQIQPPETGKREEFRESWFNDVMTFWRGWRKENRQRHLESEKRTLGRRGAMVTSEEKGTVVEKTKLTSPSKRNAFRRRLWLLLDQSAPPMRRLS